MKNFLSAKQRQAFPPHPPLYFYSALLSPTYPAIIPSIDKGRHGLPLSIDGIEKNKGVSHYAIH